MICPICTFEMTPVVRDTYRCARDEVLLTLNVSRAGTRLALTTPDRTTARVARENSQCPRHALGIMPRDVHPTEIQLGDLLVYQDELRKVVNLQRIGRSGIARRVFLEGGGSYIATQQGRVYRFPSPPPSTPARAIALHRTGRTGEPL